jgi:transcriptional regulator with XRE-family HTH domain
MGVVESERYSPAVLRSRLAKALRRLREEADVSLAAVTEELGLGSPSTLGRWENDQWSLPDPDKIERLLTFYGVTVDNDAAQRDYLLWLARAGQEEGWWDEWKGKITPRTPHRRGAGEYSNAYIDYIGLEAGASKLWTCDPLYIAIPLQTQAYSKAFLACRYPQLLGDRSPYLRRHLAVLEERKKLLDSDDPLELWVVVDQVSLHRRLPGMTSTDMAAQLAHLAKLAGEEYPHIVVQVIPWEKGPQVATNPFTILRFRDPLDAEVGWQEKMDGPKLSTDPQEVSELEVGWHRLVPQALPVDKSLKVIERVAEATAAGQSLRVLWD